MPNPDADSFEVRLASSVGRWNAGEREGAEREREGEKEELRDA